MVEQHIWSMNSGLLRIWRHYLSKGYRIRMDQSLLSSYHSFCSAVETSRKKNSPRFEIVRLF